MHFGLEAALLRDQILCLAGRESWGRFGDAKRSQSGKAPRVGRFERIHGRTLDLENAKTFTEKLYRRMIELNGSGNPTFARLADKHLARAQVRAVVGPQYL